VGHALPSVGRSSSTSQTTGSSTARVSIARLPATSRELFGREADLAWLDACWQEGVRVASIVAFGGVGKSALVNAWLARMDAGGWRGAERVYGWSFYSQGTDRLTSSDEFVDAALRWFGDPAPEKGSPWDKGERLAALVREKRTILVLDGLEPLQWGPGVDPGKLKDAALQALIKELGAQNKGLCLISSRIPVTDLEAVGGDKVRSKDLGQLSPEAGAALLRARGVSGTDEELRVAASEYDGHSLALTLLGSYLADVADGDIRRRKEIGPLNEDERQGRHARRVMAAYEPWLGKPEIAILRILGLFDRPADEEEIAELRKLPVVPGLTDGLHIEGDKKWYQIFSAPPTRPLSEQEWTRAVAKLRRAGLVSEEQDKGLDAHPLVREHFGERLRREQPEACREGHRRLYVYLQGKAKELPDTIEEMAPLYAAVVHGCLAGKNQGARWVLRDRVWRGNEKFSIHKLGAFGSEVGVLSAFFEPPWERLAPGLSEADEALVLNHAGFALRALGRLPEAAGLMRMALDRRIDREEWKEAANSASNLSELLHSRGELGEALEQARKSVELADRSGDTFQPMLTRTDLAAVLHAMGIRDEAAVQFEEGERMQREMEPVHPLLYSLRGFQYCDLLLDQGCDAEVRGRAAQTLLWVEAQQWLLDIALDHLSLGRGHLVAAQRGSSTDLAKAASHFAASVDGLRRAGQQDYIPLGLLTRAALSTHTGEFALAHHDLDEALALAQRCGFRLREADAHLGLARLSLAERAPAAAHPHLVAARAIITETGYHRRDGELHALEEALSAKQQEDKTARLPESQGPGGSNIGSP
jgi:tetratricopeptide (TPR) repeat protein